MSDKIPDDAVVGMIPYEEEMMNYSFLYLPTLDLYIGIKIVITGLQEYHTRDGKRMVNPNTERPMFGVLSHNITQIFTREEFMSLKKATQDKFMK